MLLPILGTDSLLPLGAMERDRDLCGLGALPGNVCRMSCVPLLLGDLPLSRFAPLPDDSP